MGGEPRIREDGWLKQIRFGDIPIISTGQDLTSAAQIGEMLSKKKSDDAKSASTYVIETRFTKSGMERKTTSDFGFIGSIIAQLGGDE